MLKVVYQLEKLKGFMHQLGGKNSWMTFQNPAVKSIRQKRQHSGCGSPRTTPWKASLVLGWELQMCLRPRWKWWGKKIQSGQRNCSKSCSTCLGTHCLICSSPSLSLRVIKLVWWALTLAKASVQTKWSSLVFFCLFFISPPFAFYPIKSYYFCIWTDCPERDQREKHHLPELGNISAQPLTSHFPSF